MRDLALIGCAAGLTALASRISLPLPWTPVPWTLQPMAVLLTAAVLGARRAFWAQTLYLAAGLSGLPVFAFSPHLPWGAARLLGPTGGYLLAYPLAAYVVGSLADRGMTHSRIGAGVSMSAGLCVMYLAGAGWLSLFFGESLPAALRLGVLPFFSGDVLKILVAALALPFFVRSPRQKSD